MEKQTGFGIEISGSLFFKQPFDHIMHQFIDVQSIFM